MHGRPLGGSGTLSTATDTDAVSQPYSFIISMLYFPLCSVSIFDINSTVVSDVPSITIFSPATISRPFEIQKDKIQITIAFSLEQQIEPTNQQTTNRHTQTKHSPLETI